MPLFSRLMIRFVSVVETMESERRVAIILGCTEKEELRSQQAGAASPRGIPKQFCRLVGESTLFEQTRQRVALTFPEDHTLTIVTQAHRRFYEPVLKDILPERLVVQPRNRGTAPALFYALLRLQRMAPNAGVVIFPSDHYVEDNAAFMRYVDLAFEGIRVRPDLLIVLGTTPDYPEVDYCWIESGDRIAEYLRLFQIRGFWEKPSHRMAMRLWRRGCLWNSSVFVGQLSVLLLLMRKLFPQLTQSFEKLRSTIGEANEGEAAEATFEAVSERDFSRELSAKCPGGLAVLPVAGVEWRDP
jgi:mannose-1-phosphate guanylyltransferase